MALLTAQSKGRPRRQSKKAKRSKLQQQRRQRALDQIEVLTQLIINTTDLDLKRSYVKHIRLLAQKVQLQLPYQLKNTFCRRCSEVFTLEPQKTFTVRLKQKPEPMIVYTCLSCGYQRKKIYEKKISKNSTMT